MASKARDLADVVSNDVLSTDSDGLDVTGKINISDQTTASNALQVQSNGSGPLIRIGTDDTDSNWKGGNATIHNDNANLYLQFNNGQTDTSLYVGGGGTTCDLEFAEEEGGIVPNHDTGWISVGDSFARSTTSHTISLPYHVVALVKTDTAGAYNSNYANDDIIQSGFNFPNAAGLNATGLYFISHTNQIEYFTSRYAGASNSSHLADGFIEIEAIRFLIYKIGGVSL